MLIENPRFVRQPELLNVKDLPEFNKERYPDPEYLIWCRFIANRALLAAKDNPSKLTSVKEWIFQSGVEFQLHDEGILFQEEVDQILEHNLTYPEPWGSNRCQRESPRKLDTIIGLFQISIPNWAEKGITIGLDSGSWDIYHAGYARRFQAEKELCDILVVGIDDNDLCRWHRDNHRPYNDFPVRAGSLSEVNEIDYIFQGVRKRKEQVNAFKSQYF